MRPTVASTWTNCGQLDENIERAPGDVDQGRKQIVREIEGRDLPEHRQHHERGQDLGEASQAGSEGGGGGVGHRWWVVQRNRGRARMIGVPGRGTLSDSFRIADGVKGGETPVPPRPPDQVMRHGCPWMPMDALMRTHPSGHPWRYRLTDQGCAVCVGCMSAGWSTGRFDAIGHRRKATAILQKKVCHSAPVRHA